MDLQLVDKIVHEVKSQGVFDEFRKDSMADVDTKPAYQNLRQRVENAVKKFLSEQVWTVETNKNQLREKLRKHISESGFLDVGVERIVDQVVNPKIGSLFQPKIEGIAYKCLGVPVPQLKSQPMPPYYNPMPPLNNRLTLNLEASTVLPTYLEQVSPDSEKALINTDFNGSNSNMDIDDDKLEDEDESPPFEPLTKEKPYADLLDPCTGDSHIVAPVASNGAAFVSHTEEENGDTQTQDTLVSAEGDSEKETSRFFDAVRSQESQLSEVSSDSRISGISREFGKNAAFTKTEAPENSAVISEEAQMPKFNENSSDANGIQTAAAQLHFDINKDKIKFEGTERKTNLLPSPNERDSGKKKKSDVLMKRPTKWISGIEKSIAAAVNIIRVVPETQILQVERTIKEKVVTLQLLLLSTQFLLQLTLRADLTDVRTFLKRKAMLQPKKILIMSPLKRRTHAAVMITTSLRKKYANASLLTLMTMIKAVVDVCQTISLLLAQQLRKRHPAQKQTKKMARTKQKFHKMKNQDRAKHAFKTLSNQIVSLF